MTEEYLDEQHRRQASGEGAGPRTNRPGAGILGQRLDRQPDMDHGSPALPASPEPDDKHDGIDIRILKALNGLFWQGESDVI